MKCLEESSYWASTTLSLLRLTCNDADDSKNVFKVFVVVVVVMGYLINKFIINNKL